MNSKSLNLLRNGLGACFILSLSTSVIADTFAPPTGKISPFRRDRLPVSQNAMSWFATILATATSGSPYETPEHRRSVAKAIALAMALDPQNEFVENRLSKLIADEKPDFIDKEKIDQEKRNLWNSLKWLSSPEAGSDGNLLAALMGETLAEIFPTDPQATSYIGKSEHASWNGWVEELAAFKITPDIEKPPSIVEEEDDDKDKETPEEIVKTEPTEKRKYDPKAGMLIEHAELTTILQMYDKDKALWLPKVIPIEMKTTNHPKDENGKDQYGLRIEISGDSDDYWQMQEEISNPLRDRLTDYFGQLPERAGMDVQLAGEQPYSFRKNRTAISGPAFIFANCALTGTEPDGIVVGEIDRTGNLKLPEFFWRSMMEIAEGAGGKLIVPASAEPMFINLLALEKPEFFLKYDVLIASSPDEFVTLASKDASAQHQEIQNKFNLIKDKAAGKILGDYLNNQFVRERLKEITTQAPYHLSAKLLSIYGSAARPRYLTREALAAEIWRKVDVISEIAKIDNLYGINSNQLAKLDELYKQMRDDLKNIERYADSRNADLLKEAKDVVASVRAFGREFEGKDEMWEKYDKIDQARSVMRESNTALLEKLNKLTGDSLPK